jgi:hypothetical protein
VRSNTRSSSVASGRPEADVRAGAVDDPPVGDERVVDAENLVHGQVELAVAGDSQLIGAAGHRPSLAPTAVRTTNC